jgi:superfamily II DNA or RNA helicase
MNEKILNAGTRVRLITDPSRIGVLTDKVRQRRDKNVYYIQFPEMASWVPQDAIEIVKEGTDDVYSLLANGQFGRLTDFRRNLTYIQLSGRLANLVYSMDTTNTEFYAYQYKPVLTFLEAPSKGILIADEVGLGKTIEAGLIWTELRARFDARRLMVICPAMLREKWKDELATRFGIEATLMNASELSSELKRSRHQYPPGRAIVCSYDGLRPPRANSDEEDSKAKISPRAKLAKILEDHSGEEPLFDLIIFDEAHKLRNAQSATSKLGRLLREVSENLVLLSATPINLHSQDLFQLLNVVDEDTFSNEHIFPSILAANAPLIKAQKIALDRGSSWADISVLLLQAQRHHLLAESHQLANILRSSISGIDLTEDADRIALANKIERCNLLSKVLTRTRKADVQELRVIREPFAPHVEMTEVESELYNRVTEIVRGYAIDKDISDGFLLASPQRQLSSSMYAAVKSWKDRTSADSFQAYEDFGVEVKKNTSAGPLMQAIAAGIWGTVELSQLRKNDSKFNVMRKTLVEFFKENPDEKIIIFSYFRGTLGYLAERLSEIGINNQILMGGMRETKQDIINRFKTSTDIRILLASEVASEGVDLQFCRVLINYDLPWNPMKIEQRIGRIDRHGQKAEKISILNFCYHNTIDQRIYQRLYERLNIFQTSLGDMEAILGEKISELTKNLLCERLTPEQENARIDQTSLAIAQLRQTEQELESQASNLIAHSGHILQEVKAAHDFSKRITEQDLIIFVKDFFERHCQGFDFFQPNSAEDIFEIRLPANLSAELNRFISNKKLQGLTLLGSGNNTKCLFFNKVVGGIRATQEVINQKHPLIQFISHKLKEIDEAFFPLVSLVIDGQFLPSIKCGTYAAVVRRTSFSGVRVEERMIGRAVNLENDSVFGIETSMDIINTARLKSADWPSAQHEIDKGLVGNKFDLCEEKLEFDYVAETMQKQAENNDRVLLQVASARKHFQRQLESREGALHKLISSGNSSLIKATEAQIRKIKERFEQREAELKIHQNFSHRIDDVCHLVLKVI